MPELIVIGGGLAGSEAAWQAAEQNIHVKLYEMRPHQSTGAHVSPFLAELVCSNSLGSNLSDRAPGLLKEEMRRMGSLLLQCAEETSVPAGGALAVGRDQFARLVTTRIEEHPKITLIRDEFPYIPEQAAIIASGPLTSEKLSKSIMQMMGKDHLYFFDAISPIVTLELINFEIAYKASRYDRGEREDGDYINCPMTADGYHAFIDALIAAERIELKALN